jgi:phosphoribosylanthranilate isomerase
MVWIKICGITNSADSKAISNMGADCLGFIFSTDSPRKISLDTAEKIIPETGKILKAGVFVNENQKKIKKYVQHLGLDFVQLSGDEKVSYIKDLKSFSPIVKIIKAVRVGKYPADKVKGIIENFLDYADYILLDSYSKNKYGGTGKTIDWESIKDLVSSERLILSGGLDHNNVSRAIQITRPFGVDASSRLEYYPGKKELGKVKKFIDEARKISKEIIKYEQKT